MSFPQSDIQQSSPPVNDRRARLASALRQHRGRYVLLIGSGVSRCSGVPTATEIATDLIRKLARSRGEPEPSDPEAWYRSRFGRDADYPAVLEHLTDSNEERRQLLRAYFEPSGEERKRGIKLPSEAHRVIARLVADGYFRVALTTNFDLLIEQALTASSLQPVVICTPEAASEPAQFMRADCTVIKIHGDYCGPYMKNTPEELEDYDPRFCQLLTGILEDYGLLICGWSGEHDGALRRLIAEHYHPRLETFWALSGTPPGESAELIRSVRAQTISIEDADQFFRSLEQMLRD